MQFGSKNKRSAWIAMILGLVPDIIISIGFALYHNDWGLFFVAIIGLQIIYFLIWLKETVWNWILFVRSGRKKIKNHMLDYLKKNQYPEPDDYLDSPEAYFIAVSNNEELPANLRVKAAIELGCIASLAPNGYMQHSMRLALGTEDAIEEYKRTFQPSDLYKNDTITTDDSSDGESTEIANSVAQIQRWCSVGEWSIKGSKETTEQGEYERARIESTVQKCLDAAKQIEDEFYSSAALHPIADLLSKAGQHERAQAIIDSIEVDFIREKAQKTLSDCKNGLANPE